MQFFNREILLEYVNGDRTGFIPAMGTFEYTFEVPKRDFPVTHALLLTGEPDYFWKWRGEMGSPYSISMSIDDALTRRDSFRETFALAAHCHAEPYERNAWIKLFRTDLVSNGEKGNSTRSTFSIPVKTQDLVIPSNSRVAAVMEVYRAQNGRHENDTFDEPDETVVLDILPGSTPWQELVQDYTIPDDACAIIINLHIGKGISGMLRFGSPRLTMPGRDNIIPPLAPTQNREAKYNYVADHFSRRDYLEFSCEIDGKSIFDGSKYTSIVRRMDHELPAGVLTPGKHKVKLTFKNDYDNAVGFLLQQLDLLEYGNHDFEIIAVRENIPENSPCPVMLRTNCNDVRVSCGKDTCTFASKGLHVMKLPPLAADKMEIILSSGEFSDSFTVKKVAAVPEDQRIYLSTGDSVFIPREIDEMERFIQWYCAENIGNAICFRQSYRWGGSRFVNTAMWQKIIPLLEDYGMYYSLMIDGRELPGCDANPPEELMRGKYYLGRQAHENDGAFYYWGNQLWKTEPLPEPYSDLLAKRVNYGGIQPHTRPKRNGDRAWWFFDPTNAGNMLEAAEDFVHNLATSRGESKRHSGPSTLFHYFFQAGYDFLVSEQMYGPEELTLASLRAASNTYHAKGFGAHLATQWSSTPHDTPEHAERYFLALATCYLQGVTQINTEEGLWRMEKGFADYNRFSHNCQIHREAHRKFRDFMETHPRLGKLVVPAACIQGRYDAWCARKLPAWCREGEMWQFGDAEKSFELLKLFYPRSLLDWIYRCPCPKFPQGWYSGTPYGPVDLLPFNGDWKDYRAIVFLGWHTYYPEDGVKMLEYVKNGGSLILTKRHLSSSLIHNGSGVYVTDSALDELLGNWQHESGSYTRRIGKGEVVFFANDCYPSEIVEEYTSAMKMAIERAIEPEKAKLWAQGSDDINFAVYEQEDETRTLYALNINWWDHHSGTLKISDGGQLRQVLVSGGELVQC